MRPNPLLVSILAALAACRPEEKELCLRLDPQEATACPDPGDVDRDALFEDGACDPLVVTAITSEGRLRTLTAQTGEEYVACCYDARAYDANPGAECVIGRPYDETDGTRVATFDDPAAGPRARAWLRAAAAEHASVAAFARLGLELMAHGAPLDLLRDVHAAAVDEVAHTEACLSVARRLGARPGPLAPFPFGEPVEPRRPLVEIAVAAARQGCLVETLGAHLASIAAGTCDDRDVAAVLRRLADDEARHAVLSWRVVAWALRTGGAEVRRAVREALAAPIPALDAEDLALRTGLSPEAVHAAAREATRAVLTPAARALLAA